MSICNSCFAENATKSMVNDVLRLTIDLLETLETDKELGVSARLEKEHVHHISLQLMTYEDRESIIDWLDEIALKLDTLSEYCQDCRRRLKRHAQSIRIIVSSIQSSQQDQSQSPS